MSQIKREPLASRVQYAMFEDPAWVGDDMLRLKEALYHLRSARTLVGQTHGVYGIGAFHQIIDATESTQRVLDELEAAFVAHEREAVKEVAIEIAAVEYEFIEEVDPVLAILEPEIAKSYTLRVKGETSGSEGNAGSDSLEQEREDAGS